MNSEDTSYDTRTLAPLAENKFTIKDRLDFANRSQDRTIKDDEVLVSYDVSSLFNEVPHKVFYEK